QPGSGHESLDGRNCGDSGDRLLARTGSVNDDAQRNDQRREHSEPGHSQTGSTRSQWNSIDRTVIRGLAGAHTCPDTAVIAQTRFIDAPGERVDPLQVEPVQLQWKTEELERRLGAPKRRVKPLVSEECSNGARLMLRVR